MKFNAFISYRHVEPDIYVAKKLQQKLEHFKLPKSLRKKFPKERWRITRVFRDQDELPLADSLSEEIDEALKESEYLIAVCSPRYKESEWCKKEIEDYTKMYGLEKTLLVLVEGEPEDSFPENQLYRDKIIKDENGNTELIREDVEPLAADVRGTNNKERDKKIDDAVVRLAAMMYELDYDDLRRRHREQKIRRMAGIASICAGVFFVFGLVCLLLFMRINSLTKALENTNENLTQLNSQILENERELQEKNDQLEILNNTLQEQYKQEQIKYAESAAENAENTMKHGRLFEALKIVRDAMPDTKDGKDKPYIARTEYMLSEALFEYDFNMFVPESVLPEPDENEYDEFWGSYADYYFLEDYMGGDYIAGAGELSDGTIMLITDHANFYRYNPEEISLTNYTRTWFDIQFDAYINRGVYRNGKLYLWFNKTDYVTSFTWKVRSEDSFVKEIGFDDFNKIHKSYLDAENPVMWSDDGKIRIEYASPRVVNIFRGDEKEPTSSLLDHTGKCFGIYKLEETDYYAIIFAYDGYILNENMEEIARVKNYYGYSAEDNCFLQFDWKDDNKGYKLYKYPFRSYEELIEEADKILDNI